MYKYRYINYFSIRIFILIRTTTETVHSKFACCALIWLLTYAAGAMVAESLCSGRFHNHLRDVFAPHVVRYVDLMESSIAQSIHKGFEKETWKAQGSVSTRSVCFCFYFYERIIPQVARTLG